MKRKAVIIIEDYVLEILKTHAECDPEKECGGFLFGRSSPIKQGVIHCYVDGIYSGYGIPSTDNRFEFSPQYWISAEEWGRKKNLKMIGIYHSHGIYKPTPSEQDLKTYDLIFPHEGLSIIYSPTHGIHADYICRDSVLIGNDIYIKNKDGSYRRLNNIDDSSNKKHPRRQYVKK